LETEMFAHTSSLLFDVPIAPFRHLSLPQTLDPESPRQYIRHCVRSLCNQPSIFAALVPGAYLPLLRRSEAEAQPRRSCVSFRQRRRLLETGGTRRSRRTVFFRWSATVCASPVLCLIRTLLPFFIIFPLPPCYFSCRSH
jgi:hypothetical protein